jgi:precorrin-2/cobalt-factor-2 C20-methyltransferase
LPLVRREEKLAVLSGGEELAYLEEVLSQFETTVLLKVSKNYQRIVDLLAKLDLKQEAVFVSRCGQQEEQIISDLDSLSKDEVDYLSLIIVNNSEV